MQVAGVAKPVARVAAAAPPILSFWDSLGTVHKKNIKWFLTEKLHGVISWCCKHGLSCGFQSQVTIDSQSNMHWTGAGCAVAWLVPEQVPPCLYLLTAQSFLSGPKVSREASCQEIEAACVLIILLREPFLWQRRGCTVLAAFWTLVLFDNTASSPIILLAALSPFTFLYVDFWTLFLSNSILFSHESDSWGFGACLFLSVCYRILLLWEDVSI